MSSDTPMRPSRETRETEAEDARRPAGADRPPTDEEGAKAEEQELAPDVAAHEREMQQRGAEDRGEGRIP
jgi:hypothetical protein